MKHLIETEADVSALVADAESWVGTPFFKGSRAKGISGGVDCVNLICALVAARGLVIPPLPDNYPLDHTNHNAFSLIESFIEEAGLQEHFKVHAEIIPETFRPGDILFFEMNNDINHVAMVLPKKRVVHCLNPSGVRLVRLDVVLRFGQVVKVRTPLAL